MAQIERISYNHVIVIIVVIDDDCGIIAMLVLLET